MVVRLFYLVPIVLPLWGFSLMNISERGIRPDWALIFIIFCLFVIRVLVRKEVIMTDRLFISLIAIELCVIASGYIPLVAGSREMLVDYFTSFFQFQLSLCLFVVAWQSSFTDKQLLRLLKNYFAVSVPVAALGIIQLLTSSLGYDFRLEFSNVALGEARPGYERLFGNFKRATSFFAEPRQFGNFMLTKFLILVGVVYLKVNLFKAAKTQVFMLVMFLGGLISSLSMSAYILFPVSMAFVIFLLPITQKRKIDVLKVVLGIPLLLFLIIITFSKMNIFKAMMTRLEFFTEPEMLFDQLLNIQYKAHGIFLYLGGIRRSLEVVLEYPLFGVGLNNMHYYYYFGFTGGSKGFFALLGQIGLIGTASLIWFFVIMVKRLKKLTNNNLLNSFEKRFGYLGMLFIACPLVASFGSGLYGFWSTFFWFDIAVAGAIIGFLQKRTNCAKHSLAWNEYSIVLL